MTTALPVADSGTPFTYAIPQGFVFEHRGRMPRLGNLTLFDNSVKTHSCFPSKMRYQAWPSDDPEVAS